MIKIKLFELTILSLVFTLFAASTNYAETQKISGKFNKYLEFTNGDSPNQLLWMIEENGTPVTGTLQGPMAFVSLKNGSIWVADTQNARFCLFSKDGKNLKEINLLKIGKEIGLPNPPAIADFCLSNNLILAADDASNSILEIDTDTNKTRIFKPSNSEKGKWFQITHLYSDKEGRIYVDDILSGKIIILDKNGKYISEIVAACISVSPNDSSMASIRYLEDLKGESEVSIYQILTNKGFSTQWTLANNIDNDIENDNIIMNISIIGIDKNNNIYVVYETKDIRFYNIYSFDGTLLKTISISRTDAAYNPARPDWIDESGNIYTVTISNRTMKILKLEEIIEE